jgi:multicomponent Na+:H+ antiporter subunit E
MRLIFWSILLFVLWLILSANLEIANIIIGIVVSFSISILYITLFEHSEFEFIHPIWFLIYVFVLCKNLILSNIQIAKRVLSRDMKLSPAIVAVKTDLKSDWKKLLLANSITLTPGTLTLDIKEDILYIHVIEFRDGDSKENLTKEFEKIIAKI